VSVCFLGRDLLFYVRIADAAGRARTSIQRVDAPDQLPPAEAVSLVIVDWADRTRDWGERLAGWRSGAPEDARPRLVLYGPHTDLDAHAAARAAGLGPMLARSKLVAELDRLFVSRAD
jgi:hypothetical protein